MLCLCGLAYGDPSGSLDKSFNRTGQVKDSLPQFLETVKDVELQNDGKILVAGSCNSGDGSDTLLARYTSGGKLDTAFNGKGYIVNNFDYLDYFTAVKTLPDGKIVAVGSIYSGDGSQARLIVCRYNSNGTPDKAFNGTGYLIFSQHAEDTAFDLQIDSAGRIITAGYAKINDQFHVLICRFAANGTLDSSFAANGYYTSESPNDAAYALVLQHDGKIVAAGSAYSAKEKSWVLALFAFSQNGKPDTGFNGNGRLIIPMAESSFYALALSGNGDIIAGGYSTFIDEANYIYQLDPIIFRIHKNGVFDGDFNEKWAINLSIINLASNNMVVTDVAVAPDGKIVFCGYQYGFSESSYDIFVCRYKSDGNFDVSFGQGGYAIYDFGNTFDIDASLAITKNGSIIITGNTSKAYREYDNEDLFLLKLKP